MRYVDFEEFSPTRRQWIVMSVSHVAVAVVFAISVDPTQANGTPFDGKFLAVPFDISWC